MKTKYCVVCGTKEELQNHHFVPMSLGGKDEDNNILTLCTLHHNFIHKMEGKLNHNQLIKNYKQKRIKEGLFIGGYLPFGYKKEKAVGAYTNRNKNVTVLWKLSFDYESIQYKILCDIMSLYKNPIKTFREFSNYILKKYNIKIHYSQICKIRKNEIKNNLEYWKEKMKPERQYILLLKGRDLRSVPFFKGES